MSKYTKRELKWTRLKLKNMTGYADMMNLSMQEIIHHSESKDEIIKELISLNLWQARRLKHQQYKDFAYDELEKITDEKYERI